jgi:O-antigen/teichoic acid export membrane protein
MSAHFIPNPERIIRLAKEGCWVIMGQAVNVLSALVLVRILTEHLQPQEYGKLALGLSMAGLVNQVALGAISSGITRFYSIASQSGDVWGYLRTSQRLLGHSSIVIIMAAILLFLVLSVSGQSYWIGLAVVVLVFSIVNGYYSALGGIKNAARQRATVALHGGAEGLLKIVSAFAIIAWLGPTSEAVAVSYVISSLMVTVSLAYFSWRYLMRFKSCSGTSSDEDWAKRIWLFSWPLMVGGLFNWGYYASQRWALELFVSISDVGKFYVLTQIAYTPISMGGALLMSFILPILYARAGDPSNNDSNTDVGHVVYRLAMLGTLGTLAVAGLAVFFHDYIFRHLVADQYRDMSRFMPIVVIAAGFLQVSMAISILVTVKNKTVLFLQRDIIGNGLIIAINFFATSHWGVNGLIISMFLGSLIHLTWILVIVTRKSSGIIIQNRIQ